MSKLVKILLGIVAFVVLAVAAVFYFTSGMVEAADEFFIAVKQEQWDKAYSYLAEDFRSGTSMAELEEFLDDNAITNFKQANWNSRTVNLGQGTLSGSVVTEAGGIVPIVLRFVKESDGWKIYSIQKPASGIQQEPAPDRDRIPAEKEQVRLIAESMRVFADSVNEKSMARFRSHVSNLWQQQFAVEWFDQIFGPFYEAGVDLRVLDNFSPQFTGKPGVDENGVLRIAGRYPTRPNQVVFEQKYIYEGLGWKLVGFSVNIE